MPRYHLFDVTGVELEYMIVDRDTLAVRPIADALLAALSGQPLGIGDADDGPITWSNELVMHVIEFKTGTPAPSLDGLADHFQSSVCRANALLAPMNAMLMPTAMHPTYRPEVDGVQRWHYEYSAVYDAYNRIFDCRGHGWSNVQSTHINLPFAGDDEFGRLHAAIRLVLPLLPGLAASSPIVEGRATGLLDNRLDFYRRNQARVPSIAGDIIPEPVYTEDEYRTTIFERAFADIAPHDPDGILRDEFLNSRGAIARFERGSIEIRLLDLQERPAADLAIVALIVAVLRALCAEKWSGLRAQKAMATAPLVAVLSDAIRHADAAVVADPGYLRLLGAPTARPMSVGDLWRDLANRTGLLHKDLPQTHALRTVLDHGCLAQRLLARVSSPPSDPSLRAAIRALCDCLQRGEPFLVPN